MSTTTEVTVIYEETELDQAEFERLVIGLEAQRHVHTCRKFGGNVQLETWSGQTDLEAMPACCGLVRLTFWETTLYRACFAPFRGDDPDEAKKQVQQFLAGLRWG